MSAPTRTTATEADPSAHAPAAWVITAAPLTIPILLAVHGVDAHTETTTAWLIRGLACLIALGLALGGGLRRIAPRLARGLSLASAVGFGTVGVLGVADAPVKSFIVALAAMALVTVVPARARRAQERRQRRPRTRARTSAWIALIVTLGLAAFQPSNDIVARIAAVFPAMIAMFEARLLLRTHGRWQIGTIAVGAAAAGATLWNTPALALLALSVIPAALLLLLPDSPGEGPMQMWSNALTSHPARLLLTTFALIGIAGGVALTLPAASTGPPLSIIDGLFTAISAVCVTGLIVVDTPVAFTGLGEAIVLVLIQVGGLGILTFTTAAFLAVGELNLRSERVAARILVADPSHQSLGSALGRVLIVTLVIESVGALILTGLFVADGDPMSESVWRGTFTAISAYCNAGFALHSDSLIPYSSDPAVLLTISGLIIAGGLGPAVIVALPAWVARRPTTLFVRVVLSTSIALLLVPAVLLLFAEWNHSLAGMSVPDRVLNAWFLSVTTRTAGFNSVDMGALTPATITIVIMLMFVGGSPGSTAGGLKTTTAAVLLLASLATARGATTVEMGRRRIPEATIRRALAATGAMIIMVVSTLVFLQLTQSIPPVALMFEVVSAAATVGLSLGVTSDLDAVGRLAIAGLMLVGRVGPLVFLGVLMPIATTKSSGRPREGLPVG